METNFMKKYLLTARANIIGVSNDIGLQALNGYGEMMFEFDDNQTIDEISESAKNQINKQYPDCHFDTYELKEIK
jgi:hypothetical protein